MNDKNRKMLTLLSSILEVPLDKLLDVMISKYVDNMAHEEFEQLKSALETLEQEEVDNFIQNLLEE